MVFNVYPYADDQGQTQVMVTNRAGDKGAGISFNTNQLPVFTLWKNTDTLKQGYVTGLEPGTSFAYPVTIEREQKRVRQLEPGQSAEFTLVYSLLSDKKSSLYKVIKKPKLLNNQLLKNKFCNTTNREVSCNIMIYYFVTLLLWQ